MSVVKTLALGASILGSVVAPTFAGSIRAQHRIPDRPNRSSLPDFPTSLPVNLANHAALPVRVIPAAENLANLSGYSAGQNWTTAYTSGNRVASGSLSFASVNQALVSYAAQPALPIASVPSPTPIPVSLPAAAPVAAYPPAAPDVNYVAAAASGHTTAAFINFSGGPFSEAQSLTTGNPQAWYQSTAVQSVFHGTPTAAQQAAFTNEVLQVVQDTYARSGLNISLTTDPSQNFAHTMSVVSGASFPGNSQAIGITDVGNDGFSFIDKFNMAKTPEELATAVGHNVAHELMHAFGVAGHPDITGSYLDAATANWSTLTSAQTTFSPQAVQMLSTENFLNGPGKNFAQGSLGLTGLELLTEHHSSFCNCAACNCLHRLEAAEGLAVDAAPVPEPTTFAVWGLATVATVVARRRTVRSK